MRCALVLFSNAAFEGIFRVQVFVSAGIDRCAISWFASKPGRNLQTQISRRWLADVGIAAAISKPGALCQASYAGHQAAITCGAVGGR
jgi:hypothetical protein